MQLAKREWHSGRWRGLLSAIAVGAVLGVLGPFGSQTTLPTTVKYAFWMGLTLAGFAAAATTARLLPAALADKGRAAHVAAIAALSAVPLTFVVAWAMGAVRPGRTFDPLQMLGLYPFVALVQVLITAVALPPSREPNALADDTTHAEASYPPEFLAKLPTTMREDILAFQAEDHYLRVHTRSGSALILMRLADAAAMIDPRLGLRVHRSWWVARDAVEALENKSGRVTARLSDGSLVPVSRSYLAAARRLLG